MTSENPRNNSNGGSDEAFDPTKKLIKVKGGQLYLPVRDRLVWLRQANPTAKITTTLLHYFPTEKMFIVHARVELEDGSVGEGLGQETEKDFPAGHLEKAETKAIGRALASLGYGTQWALELKEQDSFADSPIPDPTSSTTTYTTSSSSSREQPPTTTGGRSPAAREALREEVRAALEKDPDAQRMLPKGAAEMSEDELEKCLPWLKNRAVTTVATP